MPPYFSTLKSLVHAASQWWGHRGLHQRCAEVLRVRLTTRALLLLRTRSGADTSTPSPSHSTTRSTRHQDPLVHRLGTTLKPSSFTRVLPWFSALIDLSSCPVFYKSLWVNRGAVRDYAAGLRVLGISRTSSFKIHMNTRCANEPRVRYLGPSLYETLITQTYFASGLLILSTFNFSLLPRAELKTPASSFYVVISEDLEGINSRTIAGDFDHSSQFPLPVMPQNPKVPAPPQPNPQTTKTTRTSNTSKNAGVPSSEVMANQSLQQKSSNR